MEVNWDDFVTTKNLDNSISYEFSTNKKSVLSYTDKEDKKQAKNKVKLYSFIKVHVNVAEDGTLDFQILQYYGNKKDVKKVNLHNLDAYDGSVYYRDIEGKLGKVEVYKNGVVVGMVDYLSNSEDNKLKEAPIGENMYPVPVDNYVDYTVVDWYNVAYNAATGILYFSYTHSVYHYTYTIYVPFRPSFSFDFHEHELDAGITHGSGSGHEPDIDTHEEEVILDPSFINNDCLNDVFNKFREGDNTISHYIENFIPDGSVANLNIKTDDNFGIKYPDNVTAGAFTSEPNNYMITITFNTDPNLPSSVGNFSSIILAVEFMHEMIHAEMYRKLLAHAQQPEIPWTEEFIHSLRNDFNGLADYYTRWWLEQDPEVPAASAQHQLMAEHYIDIMIDALSDYDDNQHSQEFYEALSWIGLKKDTVAWNNLSPEEQANINSQIQNAMQNGPCTN